MGALAPSVAAIRVAVRRHLADLPNGATVLVACSGGADSLALATAAHFEAQGRLHCGLVTVDHDLQEGSAERAAALTAWARGYAFSPVLSEKVSTVGRAGGPEAAAREARYAALVAVARRVDAAAVLLGHTRDDQAETVLLALARGAGPRGMAGMPARRTLDGVTLLRPLLDIARAETRAACAAQELTVWEDPHNVDPAYARARVRAAMPALVSALGADIVANLARSARLLAADNLALDDLAAAAAVGAIGADHAVRASALVDLPDAIRTRVLHRWVRQLGVGGALSHRHVDALDALVTRWRGQGPVSLPGGMRVVRRGDCLVPEQFPPDALP